MPRGFLDVENRLADCGIGIVAGVDEAGRGPLAGPVVAAAVVLDRRRFPQDVNDSKALSEKTRLRLYSEIVATALAVGVGVVPPRVIDCRNIVRATLQAMTDAVEALSIRPEGVVVDGRDLPDLAVPVIGLVRGDSRCLSVAAASVVAKVTRDRIMQDLDLVYPGYDFGQNKGYGTRDHIAALMRRGPTAIHRFSFEPLASLIGGCGG
ncbi:MAG: ribonuclease HII [bacterium]